MKQKLSLENIASRVDVDANGCWIWNGAKSQKKGSISYGWVGFNGTQMNAHRASWILHKGEIAPGLFVCHKCDVPLCINPDHLFLGTHKDNMKDMREKGRSKAPTLMKAGSNAAKLSLDEVRDIRALLGTRTNTSIARLYGVSNSVISSIKNGISWRNYV